MSVYRTNGPLVFTIYEHGDHLGQVTSIILIYFHTMYLKVYIQNVVKKGEVVSEKSFNFHMYMTLGQGQEVTLTFNTHIQSLTQ